MFNEKLSKEEYERRMSQLDLSDLAHREKVMERVKELQKSVPNLGIHQFQTEDCIGDHLTECKNCYQCYDGFKLEDCLYNIECNGNKNSGDLNLRVPVEPFTEVGQIAGLYNQLISKLQETVAKTDTIVKNIKDGIITFTKQGILTSMNPGAETPAVVLVPATFRAITQYQ